MEKIVIIPTFNEQENISKMLQTVFGLQLDFHVLVVDDGSPDGTASIVKEMQNAYPGSLFLAERKGKLGLGTAYIHGFKWAIDRGYDYIFEMDADFSHNPADLPRLYQACKYGGADVAVGSRYVKGGGLKNWPWDRIVISKGGALYTRLILWMPVADPTAGFICYKRKVLETINLNEIHFVGYAFQIEMKFAAWKLGFRIVEVPIEFSDRAEGDSKMSKGIVQEGIFGVLKLRWYSFFTNYRRRVKSKVNLDTPVVLRQAQDDNPLS